MSTECDAEVRSWRIRVLSWDSGATPRNIYDDWDYISEWAHENWRARYRAHLAFDKEGE